MCTHAYLNGSPGAYTCLDNSIAESLVVNYATHMLCSAILLLQKGTQDS